jgi:hypothetical protein
MINITETNVLLAVIGSVGVIATAVVYLFAAQRNQTLELQLKKRLDAARLADVIDPEFL